MRRAVPLAFLSLLSAAVAVTPATGKVTLLAMGAIEGSAAGPGVDLSGLSEPLENGLPGNMLGGIGSGLAYAGGTTFVAVPDRGPNATPYNKAVDDTVSFISRFQTLSLRLVPASGGALPFTLSAALTGTTLLSSAAPLIYGAGTAYGLPDGAPRRNRPGIYYFTGRSDNYGPGGSGNLANARFDPESVRVARDGKSVFVSDEYGPYVRRFDRATGRLLHSYRMPADLLVATVGPTGDAEKDPANKTGRVANKGMEGLAITPDGKTLVGIMQAALIQDAADPATARVNRIVTIDIASGATREFAYPLTAGSGVSDIVAVSATRFLVDERDGKGMGDGTKAKAKHLFLIDLAGAKDISGKTGAAIEAGLVRKAGAPFLDLVAALTAQGMTPADIPAKIEGLSFGPDVTLAGKTLHTLYIANDNDFVPATAGPSRIFVFGFTDADLPGYVPAALPGKPTPR